MKGDEISFKEIKSLVQKVKKIAIELDSSSDYVKNANLQEKKMLSSHMKLLKKALFEVNKKIPDELDKLHFGKSFVGLGKLKEEPVLKTPVKTKVETRFSKDLPPLIKPKPLKKKSVISHLKKEVPEKEEGGFLSKIKLFRRLGIEKLYSKDELTPNDLEKETIRRMKLKRKKQQIKEKEEKANPYVQYASSLFSNFSRKVITKKTFQKMEEDLKKANLKFTPHSYMSVIFLSTVVSFFVAMILAAFFLFFSVSATLPIISLSTEPFATRFLKVFWMLIVIPVGTFLVMLLYPSLEKSSAELKIDEEIPFATIHMSAISGSMIDPSKIFHIVILTKEYPYLEKEFTKLINEINIYGYDLVSALRNAADNSPSKKLSEIFTGLATTINSGGDLPDFFDKRSQTLLFEHGIEKEKKTKAAETFMDIYISVVIAAPMILMMLLMMMKISGLGLSLSTNMITLIMVMSVTIVNVVFLTFLDSKR